MKTTSVEDLVQWLLDDSLDLGPFAATGAEGGFNERADVVIAADGTDLNGFWQEIQDTIALRNADRNSIIDALSYRVTDISEEFLPPGEVDFEEASEYGQPVGMKTTNERLFRGFDFKFYDLAVRYTWMFIAEATAAQLQSHHNLALEADVKLQFRKVMQRLFNPLNSNGFTEKNEPVTIYAAYNGDGEVPPEYDHETFLGSHNHYLVSGAATITSANVDDLATAVQEHGYTLQKGYRLVLWVNKQEANVIKTFRTANGDSFDFVPNPDTYGGAIWVPNNGTYVGGPSGRVKGEVGTYGPFHVVEEGFIPAGYVATIATGGQDNLGNPIGLREHTNPAYRGLKVIPGARSDYPLIDSFYRRGIGTGMRHRGAVALMQVTVNPTYTIPATYDPTAE